jgi:hypothetical protein
MDVPDVQLIASAACAWRMSERLSQEEPGAVLADPSWLRRLRLTFTEVSHGTTLTAGPYRITAIESMHDPDAGSLLYAIESGGAAMLYAVDSVEFTEAAWSLLRERKLKFDFIAIDHTYGPDVDGGGHLNAEGVVRTIAQLRREGMLMPRAAILSTCVCQSWMRWPPVVTSSPRNSRSKLSV